MHLLALLLLRTSLKLAIIESEVATQPSNPPPSSGKRTLKGKALELKFLKVLPRQLCSTITITAFYLQIETPIALMLS